MCEIVDEASELPFTKYVYKKQRAATAAAGVKRVCMEPCRSNMQSCSNEGRKQCQTRMAQINF